MGDGYIKVVKSGRAVTSSTNHDAATRHYRLLVVHDVTIGQLSHSLFTASRGLLATVKLLAIL